MSRLTSTSYRRILLNRYAVIGFACLALQQALATSSIVWLKVLSDRVYASDSLDWNTIVFPIGLFVGSLLLPYVPGAAALMSSELWLQRTFRDWTNFVCESYRRDTSLWTDDKQRRHVTALLSGEAFSTLQGFSDYATRLAMRLLNTVLTVLFLGALFSPVILAAYAASIGFSVALAIRTMNGQGHRAAVCQGARLHTFATLSLAWDHLLLRNSLNLKPWMTRLQGSLQQLSSASVRHSVFSQMLSVSFALLTFLPCLATVVFLMATHLDTPSYVAALLLALPRMFQMLAATEESISLISAFGTHREKLRAVLALPLSTRPSDKILSGRISLSSIMITDVKRNREFSASELVRILHSNNRRAIEPGRYLVRGPNGSGKSSFLLMLHQTLKDGSFYLPAKHGLCFDSTADARHSTGQALIQQMAEILNNPDVPVLLLDEWDANLDASNRERVSKSLDQAAAARCIVEVRH